MKKLIIAVIVVIGVIYLCLVLAVNTKTKDFKELMKHQPDSIRINDSTYYLKKVDSNKTIE